MMSLADVMFGRRLRNSEQETRKIGWFEAVPAMGLDGLGSASYGPEAALTILIPLGAASLAWVGWVMLPIVLLLVVLYLSYRQTVVAYPNNGGAYTVSKENLGRNASLLAAAALMVDYILNVAVGISAGVGALTSSIPALQPWTLTLCLVVLVIVTLANLRGTAEAGLLFALPTYVFIVSFLGLVGVGLWHILASGGHPQPVVAPPALDVGVAGTMSLWLFMRAFASGCTAMTGVEAVSNGVGSFKAPVTKQAHITLTIICLVLGLLLAGIAAVAHFYALGAMDQTKPDYQSVLSQLSQAIAGRGAVYYVAMTSLLAVLCLSANTSFVGFPRLCRIVAADGFLPRSFAVADRRLVFSVGIGVLTVTAGGLLILFGGITDRLIPLFAIGAFLTFSMSQTGMVVHWRRKGNNSARLAINALGAVTTLLALTVILLAKFLEGAWITVLAIPFIILLLHGVRRYYDRLDRALHTAGPLMVDETEPPTVLVAVEGRSRMTDRALQFAMTLSPDVVAIHLVRLQGPEAADDGEALQAEWRRDIVEPLVAKGVRAPRLMVLPAPYREMHEPLLDYIAKLDADTPGRSVAVLVPETVKRRWWERIMHTNRAERLRRMLLRHGNDRVNVIIAPWRAHTASETT